MKSRWFRGLVGHGICLTRRTSPVRSWAKSFFYVICMHSNRHRSAKCRTKSDNVRTTSEKPLKEAFPTFYRIATSTRYGMLKNARLEDTTSFSEGVWCDVAYRSDVFFDVSPYFGTIIGRDYFVSHVPGRSQPRYKTRVKCQYKGCESG